MKLLRALPLTATVFAALLSGACTNLSGIGGSSSYSCPLPKGGHCKPITQVYEDSLSPDFGAAPAAAVHAAAENRDGLAGRSRYKGRRRSAFPSRPEVPP